MMSCSFAGQAPFLGKRQQYYGLDYMKLACAILVIGSHTGLFAGNPSGFLYTAYRFFLGSAVPIFALASGYLLACKLNSFADTQDRLSILRRHIVSTVRLYLLWNLIYLPISVYEFFIVEKPLYLHLVRYAINLLFVGEHYLSWQLWYLLACIYGFGIVWLLLKWKCKPWTLVLAAIALLMISNWMFAFTADPGEEFSLRLVISEVFMDGRLFSGMSYVILGVFFGTMKKAPGWLLWAGILALGFFARVAGFAYPCGYSEVLATMVVDSALFLLALQWNGTAISPLSLACRRVSTVFYFTHMIWFFLGSFVSDAIPGLTFWDLPAFAWCLLLSCIAAAVLLKFWDHPIVKKLF